MIDFDFNKYCYGCKNCENICSRNAIKLIENKEGFLIPSIDKSKCNNCGLCNKVCPFTNSSVVDDMKFFQRIKCYCCFGEDEKERTKSTSGAIFPQLANKIIENGGLVCACKWNNELLAEHILTDDKKEMNLMRGSKYIQSDLNNCVKKIKESLSTRKILFVGTPCQVAAIKLYIGENANLYTCSLICEGVPSNKVWILYKKYLENKYKSKLEKVEFRNKEIGWQSPISKYSFKNGKNIKYMAFNYDRFILGFLQGLYYRNSCMNCKYKSSGHNADIIIGDFWGCSKENFQKSKNKGVSACILNSNKGQEMFELIKEQLIFEEVDCMDVIKENPRLMNAITKNLNRDNFFEKVESVDIYNNINCNLTGNNFVRLLKQIAYKLKIFSILKKIFK